MKLLALVFAMAVAQPPADWRAPSSARPNRAFNRQRNTARAPNGLAFQFQVAPPALVAQCAGTPLVGAGAQAITATRTGGLTCTRADGSLVKLTTNQPAVEANGVRFEGAGTNVCLQSEAFDSATWTKASTGGPAAPVVTANAAVAPDGTTTAEQAVFPAVSSTGTYSVVFQGPLTASTSSKYTQSVWLRAASGTATVWLMGVSTLGVFVGATQCSLTTAWSRCTNTFTPTSATYFEIGNNRLSGSTTSPTSASTVYIWGAQAEQFPIASSYIPTTGTTASRNATSYNLPNMTLAPVLSHAYTWTSAVAQALGILVVTGSTGLERLQGYNVDTTGAVACTHADAANTQLTVQHSSTVPVNTPTRIACYYDGAVIGICNAGICQTKAGIVSPVAATALNSMGYLRIGGNLYATGWLTNLCIDSTATGCR